MKFVDLTLFCGCFLSFWKLCGVKLYSPYVLYLHMYYFNCHHFIIENGSINGIGTKSLNHNYLETFWVFPIIKIYFYYFMDFLSWLKLEK